MLLVFLSLIIFASAAVKCPLGLLYSTDYNTCYLVSDSEASWTAAESICKNLGGHLPSIGSEQQNKFILQVTESNPAVFSVWIGGYNNKGTWQNSDGSPFNYSKFAGGNTPPAPYNRSVISMNTEYPANDDSGTWNVHEDAHNLTSHFICSIPICGSDGSAPASLLQPNQPNTDMAFGNLTNAWYYGNVNEYKDIRDCKTIGGHLPSVGNAFQNSQLHVIGGELGLPLFSFGFQSNLNGTWSWSDGSSSTYTNWGPFQPSGSANQNTLFSTQYGTWYSVYDFENHYYVCEFNEADRLAYC